MKRLSRLALLAGALGLGLAAVGPVHAQDQKPLTILESAPDLAFPFFVCFNRMKPWVMST